MAHLPSRDRIVLSFVDKESRMHVQRNASPKPGEPINSHRLDRFACAVSLWMRVVHVAKERFPWRRSHGEGWKRLGAEIPSSTGSSGAANCARGNDYARQPYKATMGVCKADR